MNTAPTLSKCGQLKHTSRPLRRLFHGDSHAIHREIRQRSHPRNHLPGQQDSPRLGGCLLPKSTRLQCAGGASVSSAVATRRAFLIAADKLVKERANPMNIANAASTLEAAINTMTDEPMRLLLVTADEAAIIKAKTGIDP